MKDCAGSMRHTAQPHWISYPPVRYPPDGKSAASSVSARSETLQRACICGVILDRSGRLRSNSSSVIRCGASRVPIELHAFPRTATGRRVQHESFHYRRGRCDRLCARGERRAGTGQRQAVSRKLGAQQVGQRRCRGLGQPHQEPRQRQARHQHDQAVQIRDARQVLPPGDPDRWDPALELRAHRYAKRRDRSARTRWSITTR